MRFVSYPWIEKQCAREILNVYLERLSLFLIQRFLKLIHFPLKLRNANKKANSPYVLHIVNGVTQQYIRVVNVQVKLANLELINSSYNLRCSYLGDSRNSTTATDNVQRTFWGWGGQPLGVMISFSVAAICITRKYISQEVN